MKIENEVLRKAYEGSYYTIIGAGGDLDEFGGKARKENIMDEPMTDFQFKALLKMVLEILKSSGSIEEAIAKVEALVDEGK